MFFTEKETRKKAAKFESQIWTTKARLAGQMLLPTTTIVFCGHEYFIHSSADKVGHG